MLKLDLSATERFVEGYPNAFWDGWTMVLFKPRSSGEFDKRGVYRNGQWGIATRVNPDSNGVYTFRV